MASPKEAADSSFPESVAPETEPETLSNASSPPEKQYRLYNVSGQTLYVVNVDGTTPLPPREHYDLPLSKISHHIKLMARRGFITLFEKEEEKKT
jgi:hypothetical protein